MPAPYCARIGRTAALLAIRIRSNRHAPAEMDKLRYDGAGQDCLFRLPWPKTGSMRAPQAGMSEDLCYLTAVELAAHIARKEVSPVEATRAVLARAERLQ